MKWCENCNRDFDDRYVFCTACGTKLVEKVEPEPEPEPDVPVQRFCTNCGKALREGFLFCTNCGTKLKFPTAAPRANVQPEPVVIPEPQPEPIIEPEPVVIPEPQPEPIIEPEPVVIPEPQLEPIIEPEPVVIPVSEFNPYQEEPEPEPQPYVQPEPQPYVQPEPQPYVQPQAPYVQPEPQPQLQEQPEKKAGINAGIIVAIGAGAILLFIGSFLTAEYFLYKVTPLDLIKGKTKAAEEEVIEEDEFEEDDSIIEEPPMMREPEEAPTSIQIPTPTEAPMPTEEPTPTMKVWEPLDFDFDQEQYAIEREIESYRSNLNHYTRRTFGDSYAYVYNETPLVMYSRPGNNGWKVGREYDGVDLYYVELDNGYEVTERYYFRGGQLFRVIDQYGVIHNYGEPDWEEHDEMGQRLAEDHEYLSHLFM